ncbi:hypothetical protein D4A92_23580 (plasmid) [Rhizobium rosettiformans]|uniref:Uncharacterized protein n=1 Tax=Rhizobium rosettiformans TaxID=1368430 RepID=A0ABX7F2F6_9HYPH|nr:hypothetical protein D4A92_23580 [Rhizobium rosettiformans]
MLACSHSSKSESVRKSRQIDARNGALAIGRLKTRSSFRIKEALRSFERGDEWGSSTMAVVIA